MTQLRSLRRDERSAPVTTDGQVARPSSTAVLVPRAFCSLAGATGAVVFLCLSLTPSLLPRTWLVQGVVSGVATAVGYAVGVAAGWLPRLLRRTRLNSALHRPTRAARWRWLAIGAPPLIAVSAYQGWSWQRDLHELMGAQPPPLTAYGGVLAVAGLVAAGIVGVVRVLRALAELLTALLGRWFRPQLAQASAGIAVIVLAAGVLDGVVVDRLVTSVNVTAETVNRNERLRDAPPASSLRSGSRASLAPWSTLGAQGRAFVSNGPTRAELQRFSGVPAREPIRVYAGLGSAPSIAAEADLAVAELERTGAFSRRVLCVVVTTGTGWVDPFAADALEYLHNGDTAMVGIQYSYLPSWMSRLRERKTVEYAGRVLFERVHARWAALPAAQRPLLLLFAASLGSLGSETEFSGLADLRERTDGVLWMGPTNANPMWRRLTAARADGSPEIRPAHEDVRFGADPQDFAGPRVSLAYLQNPSDPVVWWSPGLAVTRPDWLGEQRGRDVLPAMRWYPVLTFVQVTADLMLAEGAPPGHGHRYHRSTVAAWAAVAPPPGWTAAASARLTTLLSSPAELELAARSVPRR